MKKKILGIFVCTLLIAATVLPVAGNIKIGSTPSPMAIETSVDKISPYNIESSPLKITATGPSDLDSVILYYRWSEDNTSWSGIQQFSIFEGFESGSQNTSLWGLYQSPGDTRTQFNYAIAPAGSYSCAMDDDDTENGDSELNEIYTVYDFTDANDINFEFWHADADDEANPSPASWNNHGNYDAVSFTNDGTTWYEIFSTDTNPDLSDNLCSKAIVTVLPNADQKDSLYWNLSQTIPNTKEEDKAYNRIDSLRKIPLSFFSFLIINSKNLAKPKLKSLV